MTDLTLSEFPGITGDHLAQALEIEAKKMSGASFVDHGERPAAPIRTAKGPEGDVKRVAEN